MLKNNKQIEEKIQGLKEIAFVNGYKRLLLCNSRVPGVGMVLLSPKLLGKMIQTEFIRYFVACSGRYLFSG